MNELTRTWLRRIAVGLPLVSAGCFDVGACPNPRTEVIALQSVFTDAGERVELTCEEHCRMGASALGVNAVRACELVTTDGAAAVECTYDQICGGGRRPVGYAHANAREASEIAAWLTELAALEAASVGAFDDLARELWAHRAPPSLVRAARRSARDEVRHARTVASLARAAGARPIDVAHRPGPVRSLEEVALDDAVEGCARETFGAFVAAHQATSASDPSVRRAFGVIARDEARHALLSAAVLDWAGARLGTRATRKLDEARRKELDQLARAQVHETAPLLRSVLGLPSAERTRDYLRALA